MSSNYEPSTFNPDIWHVETSVQAELGERPIWDEVKQCLIWVDVNAGRIYRYQVGLDAVESLQLDVTVGAVGLCRDGGFVAATGDGFRIIDTNGTTIEGPIKPQGMGDHLRFNDGYCDPAGRFWAGTTALDGSKGAGTLYYFESNTKITTVFEGISESNGIGWSPDGRTMYYVDSGADVVIVKSFEFDVSTARLGKSYNLTSSPQSWGVPDGLVVDSEGCIWLAFWRGGALRRYSPDGTLLAVFQLPATNPTCPGFGGPQLRTLFVTTAWEGMTRSERTAEPAAGKLLSADIEVTGQHVSYFG